MTIKTTDRVSKKLPVLLGAHFSIAGGLENALKDAMAHGCNACQMFTKNANTWRERILSTEEIERFLVYQKKSGVQMIASHTSYLINLATPDMDGRKKSCEALAQELYRSRALGLQYVVLHPGSHKGTSEEKGIKRISESLQTVLSHDSETRPMILLETTAGQGDHLGYRFEQIAMMIDRVREKSRVGVCLDTSHVFAAGYDIRTKTAYEKTLAEFNAVIGLEHLKFIHLNDSKKELGSKVDRHTHIGDGFVGKTAFQLIMNDARLQKIPKVIETPKEKGKIDWDAVNLERLRRLVK